MNGCNVNKWRLRSKLPASLKRSDSIVFFVTNFHSFFVRKVVLYIESSFWVEFYVYLRHKTFYDQYLLFEVTGNIVHILE